MIRYSDKHIVKFLLVVMVVTSSMFVLQIAGRTDFLWAQILYCAVMLVTTKKINPLKYPAINYIFGMLFVSGVLAQASSMPDSYKKTALVMPLMLLPLYLTCMYFDGNIRRNKNWLKTIVSLLKVSVIIQMIWFAVQLVAYNALHIDVNKELFVNTLHMLDNASFIRNWVYYPSGLSWHSATLAPLFVMGFILFDNVYIRLLIVAEALLCGNATTFIGVILCATLMIGYKFIFIDKKRISRKAAYALMFLLVLSPVVLLRFDLGAVIVNRIEFLWGRLFGRQRDESSIAHLSYFTDYFKIVKGSSLLRVLFGYGYGCSGYPITQIYDRYASLTNWSIECDIVDILVSRGVFGFIGYYYFMFKIMLKGARLDYRYFILMFVIFVQGFGYNIQFDYVLMIEILLYISIARGVNFFEQKAPGKGLKRALNFSDLEV